MGKLVFGAVLLVAAFALMLARSGLAGGKSSGLLRAFALVFTVLGAGFVLAALIVVVEPGEVGVKHAFGTVDMQPLLPGIHLVTPWSSVERYSTREEQYPRTGDQIETMAALSSEQMGMTVDAGLRWQINPMDAPHIFTEIGTEDQIHSIVLNAIRKGVRDGMVRFSINDIAKRTEIATAMQALVDSALITQPRAGGQPFRIAEVTAFFLRDLQPPEQVVQAINAKIAQEQQIQTERHRVEVARLQSDQQRFLNQTLTAEALTKQYLEVLHDMKGSDNLVILVPTEGGIPMLDIAKLRQKLK
ncbi:MAG TPA: SPFH domain-containing protein [Gemmatimonadales bacterium]|jgi:regulator of protease activity HflC (stomatin/prohibitin superfamily)